MGKEKTPPEDRTEKKTAGSGVWEIKSESGESDSSEQKPRRSRSYSGKPDRDSQERRPRRSSTSSEKETRRYSTTSERENYSGKREEKPRRSSRSYSGKPDKDSQERRPRRSSTSLTKENYSDRREQKSGRISRSYSGKQDKENYSDRREQKSGRISRTYSGKQDKENYSDRQGQKPHRISRLHPEKPVIKPEKKDELVRLNKFIANSGICSRREADEYITAGLVSVNGQIITELGTKVRIDDDIRFNNERLKGENKAYLLLNKPKNYITTTDDPHAKKTVMELIEGACKERVYPVGRLDRNSTGVLLFTNDGDLAKQLTHPSHNKLKVYQIRLNKNITKADLKALLEGVELEDGLAVADNVQISDTKKDELGIEIHSGRNRVIRRMFEKLGYEVVKLDRVYFAGLTKKGLRRGQHRLLTLKEVEMLKMGAYE